MMTEDKSVDREEFQTQELIEEEHPKQKAVEIVSEEKPESPGTVTMVYPVHKWQREWLDTGEDNGSAGALSAKTKEEAEAKSAKIIADARKKAGDILHEVEKASIEVSDKIVAEADAKSNEIIKDSQQKAEEILDDGRRAAAELINRASLQAAEQANDVITEARQQADLIIQEAREVANDIVTLNKPKKTEGKITGRELIISATLILIGIVVIVSAYLYVRFHA
jgi:F0F1-type ATP synthase membrane subunit b/b'